MHTYRHLNDGTSAYLQTKVSVPQKDQKDIYKSIFDDNGLVNADQKRFWYNHLSTRNFRNTSQAS